MLIYITVNEAAVNSGKHHHGAVNLELLTFNILTIFN